MRQQLTKPTGSDGLRCHADRSLKVLFFYLFLKYKLQSIACVMKNSKVCLQGICMQKCMCKNQINVTEDDKN